jgi:hypothetical protein
MSKYTKLSIFLISQLLAAHTTSAADRRMECVYSRGPDRQVIIFNTKGELQSKMQKYSLSFGSEKPFGSLTLVSSQIYQGSPVFNLDVKIDFFVEDKVFKTGTQETPYFTFEPFPEGKELSPEANPVRVFVTPEHISRIKHKDGTELVVTCRRCAPLVAGACRSNENIRELFYPEIPRSVFDINKFTHEF